MPQKSFGTTETFRGLIPLRVALAACAVSTIATGLAMPWLGPDDQRVDTFGEYLGLGALMAFCLVAGTAGLAACLERVVVDDEGLHRRNVLWRDRSTRWREIVAASVNVDAHNIHPTVTTVRGRTIRLRGAASLSSSPRSTAVQAYEAIAAHLP